jgi:cobalt/nickel transport system ATP-binding protein
MRREEEAVGQDRSRKIADTGDSRAATVPAFELAGVHYSYHGVIPALAGIDLAIRAGESLVVLGANGCGKSTLLKLLDGLLFPTAGEVRAFGTPLSEAVLETDDFRKRFRSRVGLVFQNPDIQLFSPTVFAEIVFGPLQLGLSPEEAADRAEDVLTLLGIGGLRNRSPLSLSGGEKKKVAIASVLSLNPDILLFDEPTATLDPRTRHWFGELALMLAQSGKTLVTATHNLYLAERIATRILVMGEDHLVAAAGDPATILADRGLLVGANLIHAEEPFRFPSPPA